MTLDPFDVLKILSGGGLGAAAVTGLFTWLHRREAAKVEAAKAKIEAPADMLGAMAAFQKALNEQAEQITAGLRSEHQTLLQRIEHLEGQNVECRAENDQLRGEMRDMKQWQSSLEDILRRNDIPIPPRHLAGSFMVIENDRTTVLRPRDAADAQG